jgi:ribosome-binding factor A
MSGKTTHKKSKLTEKILNDLNILLRQDFGNPELSLVSFTRVDLSDDYSVANVYWDTFNTERKVDIAGKLKVIQGKLRTRLAGSLKMRSVPELHLHYDSQHEDAQKIEDLIASETKQD